MNRANILRILKHRLYVQNLLQRHPEILQRSLADCGLDHDEVDQRLMFYRERVSNPY